LLDILVTAAGNL